MALARVSSNVASGCSLGLGGPPPGERARFWRVLVVEAQLRFVAPPPSWAARQASKPTPRRCGIAVPSTALNNLTDNLRSYAQNNCSPNCLSPVPPCPLNPASVCFQGRRR